MGCAPSRPSPVPQSRRQNDKPRKQNASRLSRPFDSSLPLHKASRLSRPFDPNIPLYAPQPERRPAKSDKYGDAYAQLTARSNPNRTQTPRKDQKPVDPARYADAYAQLTGGSEQKCGQMPRKDQKVQYVQGHRVKNQAAKGFKGDTLYFSS